MVDLAVVKRIHFISFTDIPEIYKLPLSRFLQQLSIQIEGLLSNRKKNKIKYIKIILKFFYVY